jgi:HEAT repeat protein
MPRAADSPCAQDGRPTDELVALYLAGPSSDDAGRALMVLHYRGGPAELAHGARLARSPREADRVAAAHLLAQLGWDDRTHLDESVAILLPLLLDPSEAVIAAAAVALGHRHDPSAIPPLVALARHPSAEVRYGVVFGLMGHDEPSAVAALVELARDPDRDVRSWATFAIGQQTNLDSPELRDALLASAEDGEPEIRGEALIGLARRGDARALPLVRRELAGPFGGDWAVEAAGLLADPSLAPVLEALYARLEPEDQARFQRSFRDAIDACGPGP